MIDSKERKIIDKYIIGQKIKSVKWLTPKESQDDMGWDYQPVEITLENGVSFIPSTDDEGNNAGAIFTNLKDLPVLWVERN
tara:strand:+ start:286 stop:528 length:243 start_codon:yes stop_codon:yes gene_type:complete